MLDQETRKPLQGCSQQTYCSVLSLLILTEGLNVPLVGRVLGETKPKAKSTLELQISDSLVFHRCYHEALKELHVPRFPDKDKTKPFKVIIIVGLMV